MALLAGSGAAQPTVGGELERYLRQVEPIRLAVNRLLEGADPILAAFHDHALSGPAAAVRMEALERRFAAYATHVNAIAPRLRTLSQLHATYAATYVLEDAYLSALCSGLAREDLAALPDTQAEQRAAIIRWRIGIEVLARSAHLALPADLQVAGRGEIAPAPQGTS